MQCTKLQKVSSEEEVEEVTSWVKLKKWWQGGRSCQVSLKRNTQEKFILVDMLVIFPLYFRGQTKANKALWIIFFLRRSACERSASERSACEGSASERSACEGSASVRSKSERCECKRFASVMSACEWSACGRSESVRSACERSHVKCLQVKGPQV